MPPAAGGLEVPQTPTLRRKGCFRRNLKQPFRLWWATPGALATPDGHIVQAMQYDSFGNPLRGLQGPVRLPLGFAGGLFDADTGLTRFVWRDYDADTGRFTAP